MRCVYLGGPNNGDHVDPYTLTGIPDRLEGQPESIDGEYVRLDRTDNTVDGERIGYYLWSAKRRT